MMNKAVLCSLILLAIPSAQAEELDHATQAALRQTQQMLTSPSDRQKLIAKDPNAKDADDKLKDAVGSENVQAAYEIASEITKDMALKTGGDAAKMAEMIQQFSKNPEEFYKSLTPEQQRKISEIAEKQTAPASPKAH